MNKQYILIATFIVCTAFNASAQNITDTELKTNVSAIPQPLESIAKLEPKLFDYSNEKRSLLRLPAGKQYGFMAESMQAVFPTLVKSESREYTTGKNSSRHAQIKNIDIEGLIPVLVASVQELKSEIDELKAEIEKLKKGK
jgi:peptidoglycan hydrolase CwlO-like protein